MYLIHLLLERVIFVSAEATFFKNFFFSFFITASLKLRVTLSS